MADRSLHHSGKQVLLGTEHYADCASPEIAADIVAMEQRALRAEELLSSMMKGGEIMAQALGEAGESFGFLHACMFGAEQHLREHGWAPPEPAAPAFLSDDYDERPF